MGLLGGLFGGGSQDVEQKIEPPKYLKEHLKPYMKDLRDIYGATQGTTPWGMPSYTGLNPTEQAAIEGQLSYLPQMGAQIGGYQNQIFGMMDPLSNPFLQAGGQGALGGQDVFGQFASGARDLAPTMAPTSMASLSQLGTTPGLDRMLSAQPNADIWSGMYGSMADNVLESFREGVLPALRADAQGAGQFGQSRHNLAQSGAAGELLDTLGQMGTQFGQMGATEAINTRNLGAQLAQNPALANLAAANQMAQFNAANQNQMGQFNAGAMNQMGQFNAANQMAGAGGMQNLFNQAYSPAMQFGSSMAGLAPGAIGMGTMPFQTMMGMGGMENTANARAMGEQERLYNQGRMDPMSLHQAYGGAMGLPLAGTPTGSTQSSSGGGMNIADLMMMGIGGYGLGRGFGWWGGGGA